jgi:hypothetical protein
MNIVHVHFMLNLYNFQLSQFLSPHTGTDSTICSIAEIILIVLGNQRFILGSSYRQQLNLFYSIILIVCSTVVILTAV